MRARTLILLLLAFVMAGTTAVLARSWLIAQRAINYADMPAILQPKPAPSVLVARADLKRGQIWPEGSLDRNYLVLGGPRTPDAFAGWVVKNAIAGGEPMTETKIVAPGDRGFLAAVLDPGMRAISVPVTVTSGISGFIFPGDKVDLLLSYPVPSPAPANNEGNRSSYEHKASQTVLRNIRVIGIDQRLDGKPGEAVVAHTATFEVTPKQTEIIALASEIGKVSLTLRSLVPSAEEEQAALLAAADGADSPMAESITYTMDSEISPLLPQRASGKDAKAAGVVTILRGSGKSSEAKVSETAPRGS
jgi:pilus assembly protein CpaB